MHRNRDQSLRPGEADGSHNSFAIIAVPVGVIVDCAHYGFHGGSHNIFPGRKAQLTRILHVEWVKTYGNTLLILVVIGGHFGDGVLDIFC